MRTTTAQQLTEIRNALANLHNYVDVRFNTMEDLVTQQNQSQQQLDTDLQSLTTAVSSLGTDLEAALKREVPQLDLTNEDSTVDKLLNQIKGFDQETQPPTP